jgi:hypothetical protein
MLSKLKYQCVLFLILAITAKSAGAIQTVGALLYKLGKKEHDLVVQIYSLAVDEEASVPQLFRRAAGEKRLDLVRFLLTDKRVRKFKKNVVPDAFKAAADRGDRALMDLFLETGNVTFEECFRQAAHYRHALLVRHYLNHSRAAEIGEQAIVDALVEATENGHKDMVDELLGRGRVGPVELADARVIAVRARNRGLVERFAEQLRTYIRTENVPFLVALVLADCYVGRGYYSSTR